ncbi:MAG: LacI family DNA-binding transcriptional regulator [Acidobacteria bacterium]|nr:LacI family DNA-binding transcriptional regulator [Acidobacteriota bacterium]
MATVSRTLNGSSLVRPATAERVRKVVQELGYVPNSSARSLSSGKSNLFGVVISDITNPFFPELISNFESLALKNGYEVVFANTNYDPERLDHALRRMVERRVEGVAILTSEVHDSAITMLRRQNIPVVTLQQQTVQQGSIIKVDHSVGIAEAIAHLMELGHRDIAFIAGPSDLWSARKRRDIFAAEIKRNKLTLPAEWIAESDPRPEGGFDAMQALLKLKNRPTAIMATNDLIALGALRAINEAGLDVPRDFSIVGIDDIDLVHYVHPPLTTIRIPRPQIAECAFTTLLENSRNPEMKKIQSNLPTQLIVRASTAAPRSN